MDFKSLFVKNDSPESEQPKEEKRVEQTSFPEEKAAPSFPSPAAAPVFPQTAQPVVSGNTYFEEVLNIYVSGLESLNQDGVEFYEVLKAVEAVDINNPMAYKMALQTLQTIDKTFTKDKALSTSQFYLDSVVKAHQEFQKNGVDKREKLMLEKSAETQTLTKEVSEIEAQIQQLTQSLSTKKIELSTIDTKYQEPLSKVEGKLQANDMAKESVLNKLQTVIQNLKTI